MKILSEKEGGIWLQEHQLPKSEKDLTHFYKNKILNVLNKDSGQKTSLARYLRNLIQDSQSGKDGVFWITEWGIWPSSENQNLFYAYRKTLNEDRTIIDAPFHIFNNNNLDSLECLLDLALYFIWGFILIFPGEKIIIRASHDEYIEVYSEADIELTKFTASFKLMEFPEFKGFKPVKDS